MINTRLVKIGHNEFRIDFKTTFVESTTKSVIVDGEEYTRTISKVHEFDSVDDFNNASEKLTTYGIQPISVDAKGYWRKIEINTFKEINGEVYYVWDYVGFTQRPSAELMCNSNSTDWFVRILYSLVNGNYVKNVLDIYNNKSNNYMRKEEIYKNIIRHRGVELNLYNYGFNNCVCIIVNVYSLLKTNFPNIKGSAYYKQVLSLSDKFPKLIHPKLLTRKISDFERNEIAMNFLNHSINYKERKSYETRKQ